MHFFSKHCTNYYINCNLLDAQATIAQFYLKTTEVCAGVGQASSELKALLSGYVNDQSSVHEF